LNLAGENNTIDPNRASWTSSLFNALMGCSLSIATLP
jgi:hypothetical protein